MIIDFKNVDFSYTTRPILEKVNFTLTDQDKTGLVGVNGIGKSTILKLIIGDERPKSGEIIKSGNMIISYLPQDPFIPEGVTFRDYVMSQGTKEHPINDYEANAVITKMKLDPERIVNNLSGGEKKRLALAKVLVTYQDFLILDEPTNHLDNDMIIYLEKYLEKYKHGLLMVTHDRYFLEKCCNTMLELDKAKIYSYKANYTHFLEMKAERANQMAHQEEKLKKYLKAELEWLHRGVEARRTKSKSRIERYEKLSKTKFSEQKGFEFNSVSSYLGHKILKLENVSKSYNDKTLFSNFSLDVLRTDHLGIVGDNGCGKSTLFKCLMEEEKFDTGVMEKGETLRIGYFSQHFELPNSDKTVLAYIEEESNAIETLDGTLTARALLNNFLFDGELLYTPLKSLSGGEKRRLQLVKVLSKNPNFLILDEPTNDLDIYTIEILEQYIDSFIGPVLCVSHDRYFLDNIADKILYYKNGSILTYNGGFSDFLENVDLSNQAKENVSVTYKPRHTSLPSKLKREIEQTEKTIEEYDLKIAELKKILKSNPSDYQILIDAQKDLDEINIKYEEVAEKYLALMEEKEQYNN